VAKEIELKDPLGKYGRPDGARSCIEDLRRRRATAPTTATILAQAIYREGVKAVNSGREPMAIKRGIDKASKSPWKKSRNFETVSGDMIARWAASRQQRFHGWGCYRPRRCKKVAKTA